MRALGRRRVDEYSFYGFRGAHGRGALGEEAGVRGGIEGYFCGQGKVCMGRFKANTETLGNSSKGWRKGAQKGSRWCRGVEHGTEGYRRNLNDVEKRDSGR